LRAAPKVRLLSPRRAKPYSDFVRHADSYDPRAHVEHGDGTVERTERIC